MNVNTGLYVEEIARLLFDMRVDEGLITQDWASLDTETKIKFCTQAAAILRAVEKCNLLKSDLPLENKDQHLIQGVLADAEIKKIKLARKANLVFIKAMIQKGMNQTDFGLSIDGKILFARFNDPEYSTFCRLKEKFHADF
jgi:hypothetical protein